MNAIHKFGFYIFHFHLCLGPNGNFGAPYGYMMPVNKLLTLISPPYCTIGGMRVEIWYEKYECDIENRPMGSWVKNITFCNSNPNWSYNACYEITHDF
jgi:hypothetical protein